MREAGIRMKLNPLKDVLKGQRVAIIDDSIVRGTTSRKIIQALREEVAKAGPGGRLPSVRALMERLEREEIVVAAGHFPAPGFGKVIRLQGRRYWQVLA